MISNNSSILPVRGSAGWQQWLCRLFILCAIAGLCFIVLVSCVNSPDITAPGSPTRTTQTPLATPTSLQLTQQYGFTEQDSGKMVTYTITTRFEITLNSQKYPQEDLQVLCNPKNTLISIINVPEVTPPLYNVGYQGANSGVCTIKNGKFQLTVRIVP